MKTQATALILPCAIFLASWHSSDARQFLAARAVAAAAAGGVGEDRRSASAESPVTQVVELLKELKSNIEADGATEAAAYDKFSCWCEDTLAAKAAAITAAKDSIEELRGTVTRLGAEVASHGAEIQQGEKDVAVNEESQREAAELREKQAASFQDEKLETEQCIGALEAAIRVLSGAGSSSSKGVLETFQEAQMLSVVAEVRGVLSRPKVSRSLKQSDLAVVQRFVQSPDAFLSSSSSSSGGSRALSAAQIANNPFGDYAPQSTQIQGILKTMYDSFASDLEKSNAEEAEKQKTYEALMETKKAELVALKASLQQHTVDSSTKTKDQAETRSSLEDTKEELAANKAFFAQTKETCSLRANEWAQRTKLRREELQGVAQAIEVLSSDDAQKTFESASSSASSSSSFLQLQLASAPATATTGRQQQQPKGTVQRGIVYDQLSGLAKGTKDLNLAKIAVAVKTGGHFDKIITMIEKMTEVLREEEQQDIKEKKWCENKQQKNEWDMEDLNTAITKAETALERVTTEVKALDAKLTQLDTELNATNATMLEMKELHGEEHDAFVKGVKDDTDAIALLEQAIRHLKAFYSSQGVELGLSVKKPQEQQQEQQQQKREENKERKTGNHLKSTRASPQSGLLAKKASLAEAQQHEEGNQKKKKKKADPAAEPKLGWETEGGKYGGREGEHQGVVAILSLIKEDLEKEIQTSRVSDAESQTNFEKDISALVKTMEAQKNQKRQLEVEQADLVEKVADLEELKELKGSDLEGEQETKAALAENCAWVVSHFDSRMEKRKAELEGLTEAKAYLAGADPME